MTCDLSPIMSSSPRSMVPKVHDCHNIYGRRLLCMNMWDVSKEVKKKGRGGNGVFGATFARAVRRHTITPANMGLQYCAECAPMQQYIRLRGMGVNVRARPAVLTYFLGKIFFWSPHTCLRQNRRVFVHMHRALLSQPAPLC